MLELFSRGGVHHRELKPIDGQGFLPIEKEHVIKQAIHGHFSKAAIPVPAFTRGEPVVGLPKGDTLVQLGMGLY